ncbi:MAG: MFS transporter [Bauldia sp.]
MAEASERLLDARPLTRARAALAAAFFLFGLDLGLWAVHIPVIAQRLALDPAILGLALLNVGLGAVISQPITGAAITRTGSRPAAIVLLLVVLVVFPIPIAAWSMPALFVATLALGMAAGACNVAINTQASEIEAARRRPTMSFFHGFFSLGALAGASLGGAVIALGWGNGSGLFGLAVVMLAVGAVAARSFLPSRPRPKPAASARKERRFALPPAAVLGLAVLTYFSNTVEGAVNDWSALYLATVRGLSDAAAASGFAMFSLAMAVCRLAGGPVVARLGEKAIVTWGGVLMALGMAVVVLSPAAFFSPFGFALVAIGAANTIPVMMGAASRTPGVSPSAAIAAVATAALIGFLIGPPVIGFIAQAFGLSIALGLLSLAGVVIALGAAVRRWPARDAGSTGNPPHAAAGPVAAESDLA